MLDRELNNLLLARGTMPNIHKMKADLNQFYEHKQLVPMPLNLIKKKIKTGKMTLLFSKNIEFKGPN